MTAAGSMSRNYSKDRVQAICVQELMRARGYQDDEIEANRTEAIAYYLGVPRGDEVDGLSKVQSLDVADMVEAVLSFMVPSLTSQSLVQFCSVGADDEEQAATESRVVQALLRAGKSNAYVAIQEAVKDALLLRNGILKVWVETESEIRRDSYVIPGTKEGPSADALMPLMNPPKRAADTEITISSIKRQTKSQGSGWAVTIKTVTFERELRMASVDPCNFYFTPDAPNMDPETQRFIAERELPSRSELVEEGFAEDLVATLPQFGSDTRADVNMRQRATGGAGQTVAADYWQQKIEIFRCYAMLGTGENGRAERWLCTMNRDKLLKKEKVRCLPYAVGAVLYAGHSFQGISLFDKLKQTQDTKTGLLRAWLNNTQMVNVPRAALRDGMVNEDDFYDVRVGGGIKVQGAGAIEWITVPDIGASCMAGLEYQDKMRSERGGASLDMMGPGLQLNSPTATGTERELGVKEQLASLMAANIAQTLLRGAYMVAHKKVRYEMGPKIAVQDAGEWLETEPGDWPARKDVNIVIGLSPGERSRRLAALGAVISKQQEALVAGLGNELTTKGQLHRAIVEWTRASGLDAPEKFWTDPDTEESRKAAAQKEQRQRLLGQAQAEVLNHTKVLEGQVDIYKVQLQEAGKYWQEVIRSEVEEMKVLGHSTVSLEAAKIGAAQRSQALSAGAQQTGQAAAATAGQAMPEAGALPAGAIN